MPQISEFVLNLSEVDFLDLLDRTGDLVIAETGIDSRNGLVLADTEIAQLQEQGRTFIGYLNVAVTDHNRNYWDDDWVAFTDPDNRDVGPLNPGAPDWLVNNHGLASDADGTTYGRIVDYTDPEWQQRLIDVAVLMVTPADQGGLGADGVFLDDVGRYFDAAAADPDYDTAQAAQDMMALVNAIAEAVHAVNPDAYIAVNGGAYIGWDSDAPTSAETLAYFDNVDALLMESQYGAAWPDVLANTTHWGGGQDFLAVEHADNPALDAGAFADWARDNDVVPHVAPDNGYSDPAVTPPPGTPGGETLTGGDGPNEIRGLAGPDTIDGGTGDDTLAGNRGDDEVNGGAGEDSILGLEGNDLLRGGSDNDILLGGLGRDEVLGNRGDDILLGGNQSDMLQGQEGNDRLFGGADADTVNGGAGNDTVAGGDANDRVLGGAGNDRMFGNLGDDRMLGGLDRDTVEGHAGNDTLRGGADDDVLRGGLGDDLLLGELGDDTLAGGRGDDTATGGAGADTFVFFGTNIGADTVTDFMPGTDTLRLDDALWADQVTGPPLTPEEVVAMFGDDSSGTLILDFGSGNTITLDGVSSATGVFSDIEIF